MKIKKMCAFFVPAMLVVLSGTALAGAECQRCGARLHCVTDAVPDDGKFNWIKEWGARGSWVSVNNRSYRNWKCTSDGAIYGNVTVLQDPNGLGISWYVEHIWNDICKIRTTFPGGRNN